MRSRFCEGLTLCRGHRPYHARKDRVGTWETSFGPQSLRRSRATAGRRGAEAAAEQARSRTSLVVPMKRPNKAVRSGGGGRGGKGARSEERRAATHAPGSVPDTARHRSRSPADRWRPNPRSRSTSGRSPVRESRTPGSVRGAASNRCPYRDWVPLGFPWIPLGFPWIERSRYRDGRGDGRVSGGME